MPSSLPADKNFGEIVEGEVIVVGFNVVQAWNTACSEAFWAGQLILEERKHPMHEMREATKEKVETAR